VLKKTITYQDLDGNSVTEDFYFNLTKAELAEMELAEEGGMRSRLEALLEEEDRKKIIGAFKMLISATVGRRSEDGRRFIKSEEITNEFMQTEAYSVLFMELMTDTDSVVAFAQGVMPADLVAQVDMQKITQDMRTVQGDKPLVVDVQLPEAPSKEFVRNITDPDEHLRPRSKTLREYTEEELMNMPIQQLHELIALEPGNNLPKHAIVVAMKRSSE
jgi:hypothetical protein